MSIRAPGRMLRARAATGVVFALVLAGACTGSQARPRPPTTVAPPAEIRFGLTGADVHAAGPTTSLPDDIRDAVMATLDRYLTSAVVTPLRSGVPPVGPALGELFTEAAAQRLSGPDRAVLVEEGLPRARRGVWPRSAAVHLTALTGPDGGVALVAARVDLQVRAALAAGEVAIVRQGDLVLAAENGAWRIDGYDLRVTRDSSEGPTTTAEARR